MHIELPGGHSAEVREKLKVGARDLMRRHGAGVAAALRGVGPVTDPNNLVLGANEVELFQRFQYACIVALVESWTLPDPLPTMETIQDMDAEVYDVLADAVAPLAMKLIAGVEFGPDGAGDPSSPTGPSPVSSDGVRGQLIPETNPIPTPSLASPSTSTAVTSAQA
jgi:hypothetical protein